MTRKLTDFLTFNTVKAKDILDIGDAWQNIATLSTPSLEAGLYMLGFSMSHNFDLSTEYTSIRWRINGSAWTQINSDLSDKSTTVASMYSYPYTLATGGVVSFEFEVSKQTVSGTFNVEFVDIWLNRVA